MRHQPKTELITKINVTPIIDVALVLVIILLVTAPMLSVADLPVNLPQARTREAEDERNVSITIGTHGEMAVDQLRVDPSQLRVALAQRLSRPGDSDVLVVVRADSGTSFQVVKQTLGEARAAGAKHLAIAIRQRVEDRQ
jgi:biopolymer transport protein TolR